MSVIQISNRDIKRSILVTPGWYRVRIDGNSEALSKAGDSTNYLFDATILFNADDKSEEFADVPTPYWNFNSKAKGFMIPFFVALGEEVIAESRFDMSNAVGKEIDVFIENAIYDGNMKNNINHKYRAPKD